MKKFNAASVLALGAAVSLLLAGCSSDTGDTGASTGDEKGTVTIGYMPSWTDGLSTAYLLNNQLEKLGYTVELEDLTDAGVLYAGLANGDIDIFASAWPEVTQAEYMKEFGDDVEDLGSYYDGAALTIAVPSYTQIDSLEELAADPARFGGEIIGIEPGAGLTNVTETSMMPAYGIEDSFKLVTSSTATMLTALSSAIDKQEDIVVTLWRPFWAYNEYDIKDLADPKGAMGEPESLHFLGKQGFAADHAEIVELIAGIQLDDAAYGSLESLVTSDEFDGQPEAAVEKWISENAGAYPTLIS